MPRWPSYRSKEEAWAHTIYTPHRVQLAAHASEARVVMVVGGERAGKSRWIAEEILACVPWAKEIVLVGQHFNNCQKEMDYIIDGLGLTGNLQQKSTPSVGQWNAYTHTGCRIRTSSVNDGAEELAATGESYDIVALLECGMIRESAFLAARGRVAQSRGRVFLSGTLLSNHGWYADMYRMFKGPNVYGGERFSMPSWENVVVYPDGEDDSEIQLLRDTLPPDDFDRRIAALLRPSPALIYPSFDPEIHVGHYPYDKNFPVTLWVDVGYFPSAYVVLAVQFIGNEVYVIDEVYEHRKVAVDIIEICQSRDWWDRVGDGVIDIAGRQHQGTKSSIEIWREVASLQLRSKKVGKQDGITRVMTFLIDPGTKEPRIHFNILCIETVKEFPAYKRKTDRLGNVVSELPDTKDSSSGHSMDAIAYGLVDKFGFCARKPRHPKPGRSRSKVDRG